MITCLQIRRQDCQHQGQSSYKIYTNQCTNILSEIPTHSYRVIPYQFTEVSRMTPSELDEIWCVGSPGGHMYPKGISPQLLIWLPRNGLLNILLFVIFALPVIIQIIITWAFCILLKNGFHHFKAQRISFHLVYLMASFDDVDNYPRLLIFDL